MYLCRKKSPFFYHRQLNSAPNYGSLLCHVRIFLGWRKKKKSKKNIHKPQCATQMHLMTVDMTLMVICHFPASAYNIYWCQISYIRENFICLMHISCWGSKTFRHLRPLFFGMDHCPPPLSWVGYSQGNRIEKLKIFIATSVHSTSNMKLIVVGLFLFLFFKN